MDKLTVVKSQWDRLTAVAAGLAGGVVLIIGWFGVSGTAYPAEQLPYILSAGVGGLFLLGVSSTLWLSADLRDEWRKLDRLERAIRESGVTVGADGFDGAGEFDGAANGDARELVGESPAARTARLPAVAAGSEA